MAIVINGTTGITDADGGTVLSTADLASQAQAEAGSDNTTLMTPLRANQAITANRGYDAQIFSTTGTWTKPVNAPATARVNIQMWGAGGGGARASSVNATGGAGGAYTEYTLLASDLAATVTVTVAAGGVGRSTEGSGNAGGNSVFNGVTAYGGGGGANYSGSGSTVGGGQLAGGNIGGGQFVDGVGLTPPDIWGGAAGTNQLASGVSCFGGAGGAGKSSGTAGTSKFGGNGGAIGGVGVAPGGGGGGSATTSGAGARGEVRVYTTW